MYLKLARDCYAPGAPLAQSLLHEEPLRSLKFAIRDFTQCLQTAVAWRDLEQYMATPDYTSLTGLLLMLGLAFGCGFDNHNMSDDLHPETLLSGAVGTVLVSGVMSCTTHKKYKGTLVFFSVFLMLSHILYLLGSLSNASGFLELSGMMMVRTLDSRMLVIRYISDTVSTRRQTQWMSLAMTMEALGVSLSFAMQNFAGALQGGVWAVLAIVSCVGFEDYAKRVSSPAMHQGRSLTATLICVWILFFSNFLAENSLPADLISPATLSSSFLFVGVAAVLFIFSFVTMFVKNRVFVLFAFAFSFVSLLLESDNVISTILGQVLVLLAMYLANAISITFLVKKLPLKQGEGFWNSGFLSVLIVNMGELGIHLIKTALDDKENEAQTILWPSTALSALTCLLILVSWRMLDFQISKPKTG